MVQADRNGRRQVSGHGSRSCFVPASLTVALVPGADEDPYRETGGEHARHVACATLADYRHLRQRSAEAGGRGREKAGCRLFEVAGLDAARV